VTATLGIDLASKASRTGVAVIGWDTSPPTLLALSVGTAADGTVLHDKWLYTTAVGLRSWPEITKVGIDAPFGWPAPFVQALAGYATAPNWPSGMDNSRAQFERRLTDNVVRERTGVTPLAVSVDKIGYCAMRCAVVLTEIADREGPEAVARDGSGLACEVYPDPALRFWTRDAETTAGPRESYKGKAKIAHRDRLLARLLEQLPLQDPHGLLDVARQSPLDDYLDALVCALVARACELELTSRPAPEQRELALQEGWIHLPDEPLEAMR